MSSIGFIGAGNMANAMIRGIVSSGYAGEADILVSDPSQSALSALKSRYPGITAGSNRDVAVKADILILAVKPQFYGDVASVISPVLRTETLIVTIAAGITLARMEEWLGKTRRVIRTMPNTPALVGEGMTAMAPNSLASDSDKETVKALFGSFGRVIELRESLMDPFTALSGSSPAWVFMFIEALADGAVLKGIPRDQALMIASQAVLGSARMVLETGKHPGELKDSVCSPAGTTIEAVAELEKRGFRASVIEAVRVCTDRARSLAGG
jgi:pyrroline-5-carboxylate reductase